MFANNGKDSQAFNSNIFQSVSLGMWIYQVLKLCCEWALLFFITKW